jgi:hypothetical protein
MERSLKYSKLVRVSPASLIGSVLVLTVFGSVLAVKAADSSGETSGAEPVRTLWQPPQGIPERYPDSNGTDDVIASLTISGVPIILEQTSILDIQNRLGGVLGGKGDAGATKGWLCYYQLAAPTPWVIWLERGELDGLLVAGFRWQNIPEHAVPDKRCQPLPRGSEVVLSRSIYPGQLRTEVLAALGSPATERGSELSYFHARTESVPNSTGTPPELTANVFSVAVIQLKGDAVDAIDVWKSTSL